MEGKPHRPQVQCWFILASFILKSLDWRLLISGLVPTTDCPYNQVNNKQLRRFLIYTTVFHILTDCHTSVPILQKSEALIITSRCWNCYSVCWVNGWEDFLAVHSLQKLISYTFSNWNFFWKLSNLRWHSSDFWRVTEIPKKRAPVDSLFC